MDTRNQLNTLITITRAMGVLSLFGILFGLALLFATGNFILLIIVLCIGLTSYTESVLLSVIADFYDVIVGSKNENI